MPLFLGRGDREVHGIDIFAGSLLMADEFRELNKLENNFFLASDVFNMPYSKETFDLVISNGVLHHTMNP